MFLNLSKSSKQEEESITAVHDVCKIAKAALYIFFIVWITNLEEKYYTP